MIASDTAVNGIHAAVPAKSGKDPIVIEVLTSKGTQSVVAQEPLGTGPEIWPIRNEVACKPLFSNTYVIPATLRSTT
jgi:hypothetical protein